MSCMHAARTHYACRTAACLAASLNRIMIAAVIHSSNFTFSFSVVPWGQVSLSIIAKPKLDRSKIQTLIIVQELKLKSND